MLIGHQRIWNFLTQSVAKSRLAHAYLFVGQSQIGKKAVALEFAKWLSCLKPSAKAACGQCRSCLNIEKNQHPDVLIISPRQEEKKGVVKTLEIGVDEIKSLQHQLSFFPYSAKYKVAIIDEASSMTREAANSFLKTLEEPRKNTLIILISSAWQYLLPTIISRCQLIKFLPVAEKEIIAGLKKTGQNESSLLRIAKLSANRPGLALKLMDSSDFLAGQRENAEVLKKILKTDLTGRWDLARQLSQNTIFLQEVLEQWMLWLRDRLMESSGCQDLVIGDYLEKNTKYSAINLASLIREISQTRAIIANPSFNARLALEVLMMKI